MIEFECHARDPCSSHLGRACGATAASARRTRAAARGPRSPKREPALNPIWGRRAAKRRQKGLGRPARRAPGGVMAVSAIAISKARSLARPASQPAPPTTQYVAFIDSPIAASPSARSLPGVPGTGPWRGVRSPDVRAPSKVPEGFGTVGIMLESCKSASVVMKGLAHHGQESSYASFVCIQPVFM